MARDVTASGGRGKEHHAAGVHPPEMLAVNPWLMEARKAQKGGDMGEFTRLVKKVLSYILRLLWGRRTSEARAVAGGVSVLDATRIKEDGALEGKRTRTSALLGLRDLGGN